VKTILILSASIGCLLLSSCAGVVQGEFRGPISGLKYTEEGVKVDQTTITSLVGKFTRLLGGESAKTIILDPIK
jgi:hypothetical protein